MNLAILLNRLLVKDRLEQKINSDRVTTPTGPSSTPETLEAILTEAADYMDDNYLSGIVFIVPVHKTAKGILASTKGAMKFLGSMEAAAKVTVMTVPLMEAEDDEQEQPDDLGPPVWTPEDAGPETRKDAKPKAKAKAEPKAKAKKAAADAETENAAS